LLKRITVLIAAGFICCTISLLAQHVPNPQAGAGAGTKPPVGAIGARSLIKFEDYEKMSPELARAVALYRAEKYEQALVLLRHLEEVTPLDPIVYHTQVSIGKRTNTLRATLVRFTTELNACEKGSKREAVLNFAIGEIYIALGAFTVEHDQDPSLLKLAAKCIKRALSIDPTFVAAHLALAGCVEAFAGDCDEARSEYDTVIKMRPDLRRSLLLLHAQSWIHSGYHTPEDMARLKKSGLLDKDKSCSHPEHTVEECMKVIAEYPNCADAYDILADAYSTPYMDHSKADGYRATATKLRARAADNPGTRSAKSSLP
jgi:tetratricopeptide (TPR) repeat protein